MLEIEIEGEKIALLPERALYWPAHHTLIVADLHWGKAGHFRKNGIAIPAQAQQHDEIKLASIISKHKVQRLVVAGDMFHSKDNKEVQGFLHWRQSHLQLHIDLVIGNHDILPPKQYEDWNLQQHHDGLKLGPFYIAHDVVENCDGYCIHGHVHPAVRISGKGRNHIKLDCFAADAHRMILPAFGQFTGNHTVYEDDHKHIYVVTDSEVIQWK